MEVYLKNKEKEGEKEERDGEEETLHHFVSQSQFWILKTMDHQRALLKSYIAHAMDKPKTTKGSPNLTLFP